MQTKIIAGVAKLVLVVTVFATVSAVHAQDRSAEYEAAMASIERFNEANREAGLPEMGVPSYAEWLKEKQDAEANASAGDTAVIENTATAVLQSKDGLPYTGTFKLGEYSVLIISKN
ncbi:MAG: hypothetical protein EOM12_15365 [Verrucomicrobiae bacterium]|nr:hypothetical protein [Verrucomicrobiae bacterium]